MPWLKFSALNFLFHFRQHFLQSEKDTKVKKKWRPAGMVSVEKCFVLYKKLLLIVLLRRHIQSQKQKYRKRFWVRSLFEERNEKGQFLKIF